MPMRLRNQRLILIVAEQRLVGHHFQHEKAQPFIILLDLPGRVSNMRPLGGLHIRLHVSQPHVVDGQPQNIKNQHRRAGDQNEPEKNGFLRGNGFFYVTILRPVLPDFVCYG